MVTIFASEAAKPSGIGVLGVNGSALLLQLAAWVIFFLLIKRFALDKIVAVLHERNKTIEDGIRLGREMELEKSQLEIKKEKTLKQARRDADAIIQTAKDEASQIISDAEQSAKRRAATLMEDSRARIAEETAKATEALQSDIKQLVADATGRVLQQKIDISSDEALISRSIQEAMHER